MIRETENRNLQELGLFGLVRVRKDMIFIYKPTRTLNNRKPGQLFKLKDNASKRTRLPKLFMNKLRLEIRKMFPTITEVKTWN